MKKALIAIVLCVGFVVITCVANYLRMIPVENRNECVQNIARILPEALTNYSRNNDGRLPLKLEELAPKYVGSLPSCPTHRNAQYKYEPGVNSYTIYCVGNAHADCGSDQNRPMFNSLDGLTY